MATYTHNADCITPAMVSNTSPSPVVISASNTYNATYAAFHAFDQNVTAGEYWNTGTTSVPVWVKVYLGSGNAKAISSYTVTAPSSDATTVPKDWVIQGSNNDSDWTTLDTQTGISFSALEMKTFTLSSKSSSYLYYRMYITAKSDGGWLCLGQLELITSKATINSTISFSPEIQGLLRVPAKINANIYPSIGIVGELHKPTSNIESSISINPEVKGVLYRDRITRYWVGGGGTWNNSDTTHWSETSGGTGGASIPGAGEYAIFDNNSFTAVSAIAIYCDVLCHIIVEEANYPITFTLHDGGRISLQEDLSNMFHINVWESAEFYTNNFNVTMSGWFTATGTATVDFGTSTITVTGVCPSPVEYAATYQTVFVFQNTVETTSIYQSKIIFNAKSSGSSYLSYFEAHDHVYGDVEIVAPGYGYLLVWTGNDYYKSLKITGDGVIQIFDSTGGGSGVKIIEGDLTLEGSTPYNLSMFAQSAYWYIQKDSGTVNARNCTFTNSVALGDAVFNAYTSNGNANGGGNTGWIFTAPVIPPGGIAFNPSVSAVLNLIPYVEGITGELSVTLPLMQVSMYGGGYLGITIPKISFYATGYSNPVGSLTVTIPRFSFSATAVQEILGSLNVTIPPFIFKGTGFISGIGNISATIPAIKFSATGITGVVGVLNVNIPVFSFLGNSYYQGVNSLEITLPMFLFSAHSVSDDVLVIVFNTKNFAQTEYDNTYNYNSLINFNGNLVGLKKTGIYELTGDTDSGTAIDWYFKTGKIDLEENQLKKARYVWLSYRPSGSLVLTVDDGENEYDYDVEMIKEIDNAVRIKLGKGIRNRYIQLELRNASGEKIFLDRMRLFTEPIAKKR